MQTDSTTMPEPTLFRSYPEAWRLLAPQVKTKSFSKDTMVFCHGDAANYLWLIVSGWVKLTRQTPDGKETIIGLGTEGDVFGEAALFTHANYPCNAEVIGGNVQLMMIPADALRAIIEKNASLSTRIMSHLNERTSQAQLKLEQLSTMSAAQRLGCFLLRLCHTQATGSKSISIPVEKHVLAAYLGMKPETLSRSQLQLKPLGIDVEGHHIAIKDVEKLRDFVCNSCSESGHCETEAEEL